MNGDKEARLQAEIVRLERALDYAADLLIAASCDRMRRPMLVRAPGKGSSTTRSHNKSGMFVKKGKG